MQPWSCYPTCPKMAVHSPSGPGQNSYPKHTHCSWTLPDHGSAASTTLQGWQCCLTHGKRPPFSQQTGFTMEKVQFHSDPAKSHSKWRQDQCRIEATTEYLIAPGTTILFPSLLLSHPRSWKTHATGKQRNSSSCSAGSEQAWKEFAKSPRSIIYCQQVFLKISFKGFTEPGRNRPLIRIMQGCVTIGAAI